MFSWENCIENLGDLKRLVLVLENLPDEDLMKKLEAERKNGRNDYPVRSMWNMLVAMTLFGHSRFSDMIRELNRNAQLRHICGFSEGKLPKDYNVSRFVKKLQEDYSLDLLKIFIALSDMLYSELDDFGKSVAIDSKWVWSSANKKSNRENADGRSESDATWGIKEYYGTHKDGTSWNTKKKCFGFKMHVLVDTKYELPIAFVLSNASGSDLTYGKKLMEELKNKRPHVIAACKYFMADRAYDSSEFIAYLKNLDIKAVIDKRNMWKDEKELELPGYDRVYYTEDGAIFCYSSIDGQRHTMIPAGYEADRDALRFKCPVNHYGCKCSAQDDCDKCKNIRVPLSLNERIFTQVNRQGYQWKRLYNTRTSVERVFSRLDVSFGFEARRIRGVKKMQLFSVLAFTVMNTLAITRSKQKKPHLMRSLVSAA